MTVTAPFTTDDIALLIEIPGVYDGTSAYLLKDGRLVNRWDGTPMARRRAATQAWLDQHGEALRVQNADLLTVLLKTPDSSPRLVSTTRQPETCDVCAGHGCADCNT